MLHLATLKLMGNMCFRSATSATSHVVLGQFKTCVILLGGYLIFSSDPGLISVCGAVVAIGGMTVYTSLNFKRFPDIEGPQLPKHSLQPTPKPRTDEGNKEEETIGKVVVSNVV